MNMTCKITWCKFINSDDCSKERECNNFEPQFARGFIGKQMRGEISTVYNRKTHKYEVNNG